MNFKKKMIRIKHMLAYVGETRITEIDKSSQFILNIQLFIVLLIFFVIRYVVTIICLSILKYFKMKKFNRLNLKG